MPARSFLFSNAMDESLILWHQWWSRSRPGPPPRSSLRSTSVSIDNDQPCPCRISTGSGADPDTGLGADPSTSYAACCGPIHHDGAGLGSTAEQLMRARYSAYVLHDADFLLRSWHPNTRPESLSFSSGHTWHGLTIVETVGGGGLESDGTVEFKARFTRDGDHFELHERSTFARVSGSWVYVDGFDPDQRDS